MKSSVQVRVTPEVSLTLDELELAVLGHLMGYDVVHVMQNVTHQWTAEQLKTVARSMRSKCEAATRLIRVSREAISASAAVQAAAGNIT